MSCEKINIIYDIDIWQLYLLHEKKDIIIT